MEFTIKIKCDNEAFCDANGDPYPSPEIVRILREVAKKVQDGEFNGKIRDANGNQVGNYRLA